MENIKVSVIVPIYNTEKYIEECIQSICNQTYNNLEIILVDDGTKDSAGKIADKYAAIDSRITVIHKQNQGVSAARNSGLDIATGDYICFADSDDYLMPDYVEYLLGLAIDNNVEIALTTQTFTNFYGQQVDKVNVYMCSAEQATIDILLYKMPIGVYCKIFKRSFLVENKIRFVDDIFIGEGFNFNTAAFQRAEKVCISNRRIYYYRRDNPVSATTKFSIHKWENGLYAIQNIRQCMVLHSKRLDDAWNYADWHTHCDVINFMRMAGKKSAYKDMYKRCRKVAVSKGKYAFKVDISMRERIRAMLQIFCPSLMPKLIVARNKRHNVNNLES